jgi:hypothetical protein
MNPDGKQNGGKSVVKIDISLNRIQENTYQTIG